MRTPQPVPDAARRLLKPKTAVVVIHGMGEQKPMDTLRGLVSALWTHDPDIAGPRARAVYSKPDPITGSFELRRITTRNVPLDAGEMKRADFFEFYWAHLMTGNTASSVTRWLRGLLLRRPSSVPRRLVFPWIVGLAALSLAAVLLGLAAAKGLPADVQAALGVSNLPGWLLVAASIGSLLISLIATRWLAPVAGDAARYLSPTPDNVAARQKIREAGVDLLGKLQASGYYDRIVVVGHSLGAVIGFDVLHYAWARHAAGDLFRRHGRDTPVLKALGALEKAAGALVHAGPGEVGAARAGYRAAQRAYAAELAKGVDGLPPIWLVSDFVTLGCPLSKADVLLARDAADLAVRTGLRDIPICPPLLERDDPKRGRFRFSYPVNAVVRIPHHASVFAPVVWTNVFFDNALIGLGDIVSGRVAPILGRGVLDVRLKIGGFAFRHLDYWKDPTAAPPHPWLKALRRAVNLKRLDDRTLWGAQATAVEVLAEDLGDRL